MPNASFWRGRRVLVTGHTGFKGAWACAWLQRMGARVFGFALPPETQPNLAALLGLTERSEALTGDVRDRAAIANALARTQPEFVLHMAAQSLVRRSYQIPLETFATNVQGTLNLLQALRGQRAVVACLVVTSDKVYANDGSGRAFREDDPLGGSDPYAASKAACEIAVASFAQSFAADLPPIATARAGNVIGGGDWSEDRIVPDIWRAWRSGRPVALRYPMATRPWQHVLEPLAGYFDFLEALAAGSAERALNFGPADEDPVTVSALVDMFRDAYPADRGFGWIRAEGVHPKEATTLAVDATRARRALPWRPRLTTAEAIAWTAEWYAAYDRGEDAAAMTDHQLAAYEERLA